MEQKTVENEKNSANLKKHFAVSVIISLLVCLIVFFVWIGFMSQQTERSVEQIGNVYMKEMSRQLQQKFVSLTNIFLDRLGRLIQDTPPETFAYTDDMLEQIEEDAAADSFAYVAFYSENGEEERLVGEELTVRSYEKILDSLNDNGQALGVAKNQAGDTFLLVARTAAYPLRNGGTAKAVVCARSMDYVNNALFSKGSDVMMSSRVIDGDGMFIIQRENDERENYYEQFMEHVEGQDGKEPIGYVDGLKQAMASGQDYSEVISVNGGGRNLYATPISQDVDWYLISVMPNSFLDSEIHDLSMVRLWVSALCILAIIIMLMTIFIRYYKLSKRQLKMVEAAREQAIRASQAKTDFLSSMSHDIRTPMNAITGMTEIAMKNLNDTERIEDCLTKIKLSSKHLLGLINDVLDMSKIESGKMKLNMAPMSLREVMDDIVNIVRPQVRERKQLFDIFIRDIKKERVYCDEVRMNQVLLNLLSNALKFTPEGGSVKVYLYQEPSEKGDEYIKTHMIVEDTGIGMSKQFQEKIFESFEREDRAEHITGTGLGMPIANSIVTMIGGKIELTSEEGKGSTFHVIIDFKIADDQEEEMKLPGWSVLVVDDDETLCSSAAANLEELGVHADWTTDGRKAIEMIEERHARNEDYEFALIDWKMPNMNGVQTIREIRNRMGNSMPVFLISAYDWSDLEEEFPATDIEGFISKPLFKSTLYHNLRKHMEGVAEETKEEKEQAMFNNNRLLMAEDIDINWEIANEILGAVGLVIDRVENGQKCVEKFEASEPGYYEAILMDVRMPVMDGYDATRAIRALERPDKDLPIIAMTADAFSDDAQRCFESGMNAHLTKPLDIQECMRTLHQYLD